MYYYVIIIKLKMGTDSIIRVISKRADEQQIIVKIHQTMDGSDVGLILAEFLSGYNILNYSDKFTITKSANGGGDLAIQIIKHFKNKHNEFIDNYWKRRSPQYHQYPGKQKDLILLII